MRHGVQNYYGISQGVKKMRQKLLCASRLMAAALVISALLVTVVPVRAGSAAPAAPAACVAVLDSGYTRHLASLNAWDYRAEFVDTNALVTALARWSITAAVIGDGDIEVGALSSYKALILPRSASMSQLAADNITKFVREGGRILSTSDTSLIDDFWRRRTGFALAQAMGVRPASAGISAIGQISISAKSHQVFQGITGPITLPQSTGIAVNVEPDSNVLAVTSSGLPAIVENRFGIYCAANILSPANVASPQGSALVRNIITYLIETKYSAPFALDTIRVKAALYRPALSEAQMRVDMQRIAKANFNTVMVAAYRDGMALWPSRLAPVDPLYSSFDPVAAAIAIGEELGLEVHAWFNAFDAGVAGADGSLPPLVVARRSWAAVGQDGKIPSASEGQRCFLSPAHPEVQAYLISLVQEFCASHAVAGMYFDYLHYPYGRTVPYDYNPVVEERAKADLGFAPKTIRLDMGKWNAWFQWRTTDLTAFVARLSAAVRDTAPGTMVSAAVYPNADAVLTRMQDWSAWAHSGYMDFVVQLTTSDEPATFSTVIRSADTFAGLDTHVLAMIDANKPSFAGLARAAGAYGVACAVDSSVSDAALSALSEAAFRW